MHDETLIPDLLNKLGFFIQTVTNRKILLVGDTVLPKQTDPYVMIEEGTVEGPNWHTNEAMDTTGKVIQYFTGQLSFIITVAKGDAFNDAGKIKRSFNLPWLNYEYFKDDRFAYASCGNPMKVRVPLDMQTFENRSRFTVTFNVCFMDTDYAAFENIDEIKMKLSTFDVNHNKLVEVPADIKI